MPLRCNQEHHPPFAKRHRSLSFEQLVSADKYEELRRSLHTGKAATIRLSDELELQIRRRYWILVESGLDKDGTVKRPPNDREL
jgi:hypothetical protein